MAGRVGVAVDRDHLDAEPLQRDDHFLAELAGAQQHHAQRARRQGGAQFHVFLFSSDRRVRIEG